jgi:hypothetical protein
MNNPILYVVVESSRDASILRRFLPTAVKAKCGFVVAQGRSAAISDARTLLVLSKEPVALVVDADTTNISEIKKQEATLRKLLHSASAGIKCDVFLAVPSLTEIWSNHGPVNQIELVKKLIAFVDSVAPVMK